jgi:radical SAM protein with 4Fe4S-binding SPASM domain
MALSPVVEEVFRRLWSRQDGRTTWERLQDPPSRVNGDHLRLVVERMVRERLLVPAAEDEVALWVDALERDRGLVPRVDQVELTNACPFTCPFCPRGLGLMTRPVGHMDLSLLADIAAQVAHLSAHKPFGLHHFGDPLLHPDPAGAVRVVRRAGLEPEISVNPVLLTPQKAQELLEAGVGVLILSVDGLDDQTLTRMRGPKAGPWAVVERHVEEALALAARCESPPTVMVSMVATVHNRHQWGELFRRYRRPGMPWLRPVVRLLEDFGEPAIAPLGVRRLRQLCGSPHAFVSVLWDGTVVPCCHDHDGVIPLGNLARQSLAEVWAGEPYQQFRARWRAREFRDGEPCARCRWRPDLYAEEDQVAETDAWTESLWPAEGIPGGPP